jgi:microcystin-dependent protein
MSFDKTKPAATTTLRASNPEILANWVALESAIDQDHDFATGGAQTGKHNKVSLIEAADIGTGAEGLPILGAQTTSGKAELVFTDEDDNDVQITSGGKILSASLDLKDEDNMASDSATHAASQQSIKAYVDNLVPAGIIVPYGGSSAPSGWLLCNGSAVSRTTYATLFAIIGTSYGSGDGSNTFNLPDLRGRVPVGLDTANANLSACDSLGETGGEENHTLTTSEMPSHHHGLKRYTDAFGGGERSGINNSGSVAWNTEDTGGGGSHNNLQPYNTVNYIIKT